MMPDLLIGCFSNYDWRIVQYWANSISRSGFTGDRAAIVYNTDKDTISQLTASAFRIYALDPERSDRCYGCCPSKRSLCLAYGTHGR